MRVSSLSIVPLSKFPPAPLSLKMIQPCCQPDVAAQLVPSDDLHILTDALRLIASLRASWALAMNELLNDARRLLRKAWLNDGSAMAAKTPSTVRLTISSIMVKPWDALIGDVPPAICRAVVGFIFSRDTNRVVPLASQTMTRRSAASIRGENRPNSQRRTGRSGRYRV